MAPLPASLAGQWAVVTGSSRGIGRAIAWEMAAAGANLVIHGRQAAALAETAEQLRTLGSEVRTVAASLDDEAGCQGLLAAASQTGPIDIWVNNAGCDVLTGDAAHWDFDRKLESLWKVDVAAGIRLSRAIGRQMLARGSGTILNVGWDQALVGMAGDSGEMFAAVKGAVMAFTLSLAKSLAPHVRVNCLAPGWIRTSWGTSADDYWQQRAVSESLRARWGLPEDVARAAVWLASPAADFINGQVIPINGGFRPASRAD